MKELVTVLAVCFLVLSASALTLAFWEIPAPIEEKVVIIKNEKFIK